MKMQQPHSAEQYEEALSEMKEQMRKVEEEKGRAINELREMRKAAEASNVTVEEVTTTRRILEPNAREQQRGVKDENTESAKQESEKGLQRQLAEKDVLLENMRKEMDDLRSSEANATALLSDYKRRIQELEAELDKRKESETNLFDTLVMQTKQLEQNKILLEESKLEISSFEDKVKAIQLASTEKGLSAKGSAKSMNNEAEPAKEKPNEIQKEEEISTKAKTLVEELNALKSELKQAVEAEENSKKAMDDLAFALKEVATEANQVKAKLTLSQVELEHTKGDAERWRATLESTEYKYKELLDAARKEADKFKNTSERLRLEAEESLSAWNGKETELVNCIRRADEDRMLAQQEAARAVELMEEAENKIKASKEENQKLRDILKQALNESNVAKEAAEIARAENARLQDSLNLLVHENEMLKIHEAASFENIRELKRMLSESSSRELKNEDTEKPSLKEGSHHKEDKDKDKETLKRSKASHNSGDKEHHGHRETKSLSKTFSFNLKDMIAPYNYKQQQQQKVKNDEGHQETDDDALRGSIFDDVDSSDSESHVEMGMADEFDHLDDSHSDDPESDRNSRKRRALLRRFGDLIRRRNYHSNSNSNSNSHSHHRKEASMDEHIQT